MTSFKCQFCELVNPPGLALCRRCNNRLANPTTQSHSPYGAPFSGHTPTASAPQEFRIVAVLVGWVVDIVGSGAVGIGIGISAGFAYAGSGEMQQQMIEEYVKSPAILRISLICGLLFTMIGGFVAAHMGRSMPIRHALGVGVLSTVFSLLSWLVTPMGMMDYGVLALALTIPMALFGGVARFMFRAT